MMYGTFRIIFWGIIFAILFFLLIKKTKVVRKKRVAILMLICCMTLCTISNLFLVENLFFDFKSPDKVFTYYRHGKVEDIISGKNSSMVVYSEGSSLGGQLIVPKHKKGYKIPSLFSVKKVSRKFDQDGLFDVYNVSETNDYYVWGMIGAKGHEINIIDSNNKSVKNIAVETGLGDNKTVFLFAFVENFTSEYYILVNGEKILVSN